MMNRYVKFELDITDPQQAIQTVLDAVIEENDDKWNDKVKELEQQIEELQEEIDDLENQLEETQ